MAGKLIELDYRRFSKNGEPLPEWVREVIDTHLAIESEEARKAGSVGFMARAMVMATMPYKDPKSDVFTRQNGDFKLRIVAGYEGGVPFGIYPRLLMSWLTTEVVRTGEPVLELGDSLRGFLRDVLELKSSSGGARGTGTRVAEQMRRLFGSLVTTTYAAPKTAGKSAKGFALRTVLIADAYEEEGSFDDALWAPQDSDEAGAWRSTVRLNAGFVREVLDRPVPIDLRAYKALRASPLAMDLYTWLTYRASYTRRSTTVIRWELLMLQFGAGYGGGVVDAQAIRNFRNKAFLPAMQLVLGIYPELRVELHEDGMALLPSPPHIAAKPTQALLPF